MPQPQRRKLTAVELYEQRQRQPQPQPQGRKLSAVELYEQRQAAQPPQPAPQDESYYELAKRRLGLGFEMLGQKVSDVAAAGSEIVGSALHEGDLRPAIEAAKLVGRGVYPLINALGRPDAGAAYLRESVAQAGPIAEVESQRTARREAGTGAEGFRRSAANRARLEAEAAKDPSLAARAVRFIPQTIPYLVAGAVSGGSIPALAATGAVMELDQPQNIPLSAALSALPAPAVGKFVAPVLRRIRAGRGAGAVASEVGGEVGTAATRAEAGAIPRLEAMGAGPTSAIRSTGAAVDEASIRAAAPRASMTTGPRAAESAALELADPSLATKAERTKLLEVISAARKAGLLTSVKTHIKNVAGTGGFQLSEEVARIPGAIVDTLVSRVTKQRALTGPSLGSMRRSAQEAATKGWQEAKEIWRNGITQADVERLGLNQEINSGSKILDAYINKTFRSLAVEDKLLNSYATRRALEDRARSLALTEMRQGKIPRGEVNKRAKEILDNPPEDLAAAAIADGEVAVFTNENLASKFLGAGRKEIEKLPGGRAATFGVDMVLPFTKTPTNVIARLLDYAGFGAAKETTKAIARRIVGKSMTAEQQRQFATQWGRASIGSGLIALGYIGYRNGWLTGFIEDDLSRRTRDEAAGRVPGAIKIGSRWHQILGAAPLASLLVIGATLAREVDQEREGSGLLPTLETFGQAIGEQPLLIGSKQVAESLTKPGTTGERLLGGLAGSFVPTAVSDVAEAFDPAQRETQGAGVFGALQKRIPGMRNLLPDAVDVFGQPRQDFGLGQALLDPTRATTDQAANVPLLRELVRLDLGLAGFRKDSGETTADFRRRVQSFGELYTNYGAQLLDSTLYRDASDGDRREVFKTLNSRAKHIINEGQLNRAQSLLNPASLFDALLKRRERQEAERRKTGRR